MINLNELKNKILFYKPEYVILQIGDYSLMVEIDLFNKHMIFYVQDKLGQEEGHNTDIFKTVEFFYEKIRENEKI